MAKKVAYSDYLTQSSDLVTSRKQTRAGFIALAIEKNYLAVPYIEEAKALKTLASNAKTADDLLNITELRHSLLASSGLSEKSLKYLSEENKTNAIKELIDKFLKPAGKDFVEELAYRYLITKGDALGGKARNLTGTLGERKFIRAFLSILNIYDIAYYWLDNDIYAWQPKPSQDAGLEKKIKAISWSHNNQSRVLVLNVNVSIVRKNIDLILLDAKHQELILKGKDRAKSIHKVNEKYIALGELKSGIDPAGADEHWKTANSAFGRIRNSFEMKGLNPLTFFVGAAIEAEMAREIYNQLEDKTLAMAANLTEDKQLTSICHWIVQQ